MGLRASRAQGLGRPRPNGGRFLLAAGGQYCSVKARVADEAIVRREFMRLAEAGGGGLRAEPRGGISTPMPPFSLSQLAYAWNSEEQRKRMDAHRHYLFSLRSPDAGGFEYLCCAA